MTRQYGSLLVAIVSVACATGAVAADRPAPNPTKNAYFGAVHVHTSYSFDAFTNGAITMPDDAYKWAQGQPIPASKLAPDAKIKIVTPLDFYAVSDHAEFMGVFRKMADPSSPLSKTEMAKKVTSPDPNVAMQAFAGVLRDMSTGKVDPALTVADGHRIAEAVERAVCDRFLEVTDVLAHLEPHDDYQAGKTAAESGATPT